MERTPRLAVLVATAIAATALISPAAAGAAPSWKCRASVGYVAFPGQDRIEPFVANGNSNTSQVGADRETCADDQAFATGDRTVGPLTQSNPYARTEIEPNTGAPAAQVVTAETRADATVIRSSDGNFVLRAEAL